MYPAPGFRDYGRGGVEGVARYIGNNGYSWSSAISETNGVFLDFHTLGLNPGYVNGRAHGLLLRCLSE